MATCINALKQWTGKADVTIVYDSVVDEFTDQGIFEKVKGKPNVALVATTTDGDVFGGFYSVAVTEQMKPFFDPDMFIFSFESRGRCETPKNFHVKENVRARTFVLFFKDDSEEWTVDIGGGVGWFYLGNETSDTWCSNLSLGFEGIEDGTLTGKPNGGNFTCARLVALHLA